MMVTAPEGKSHSAAADRFVAVDEMNLAELPLASISDRFLDGTKTVIFEDTVWDYKLRKRLPRRLELSGSDRYGLPTAKDDDVLLGCVQLSHLGEFASREVAFSRYELLKLLRWSDTTRNYSRLSVSLRRWKGLSVYSNRAFYDKERESWVNKDFGVIDNLYIYEREVEERINAPASSWFVWNEVIYNSFQSGYLKLLDWELYCSLESPVAKRLYRFLDKRFYHNKRVEIDLKQLAIRKIRISSEYNTAQMKRVLLPGIEELEAKWLLKRQSVEKRFRRESRGKWTVVFELKRQKSQVSGALVAPDPVGLETELIKRGIGPATAAELTEQCNTETVQSMLELFDWYNSSGQNRGPGFLVNSIRNPTNVANPRGFRSSTDARTQQKVERLRAEKKCSVELHREQAASKLLADELSRFELFFGTLSDTDREDFEKAALTKADRIKREGYCRSMGRDEKVFEQYRQMILLEHFHKTVGAETNAADSPNGVLFV
jgi:hypothetical protein